MSPQFVNPNNGAEHSHVPSTVDGMVRPNRPNSLAVAETAMDLYLDFPRFLGGITEDGDETTSWETLDEDFAILLSVLNSLYLRRSEGFKVTVRKLKMEGPEAPSIEKPDVRVIVRATGTGCLFLTDDADGGLKALEPLDVVQAPEGEHPSPRAMTGT